VSTFFYSSSSSSSPVTDQEFLRGKLKKSGLKLVKKKTKKHLESSSKEYQIEKTIFDKRFKKQICSWSENKN
jgi:hypothetical protein